MKVFVPCDSVFPQRYIVFMSSDSLSLWRKCLTLVKVFVPSDTVCHKLVFVPSEGVCHISESVCP